jgi:integrase
MAVTEYPRRMVSACRKLWDASFSLVALSGLHASEIIGLRVEDLDFDQNLIHVHQGIWHGQVVTTKTEESENTIPMTLAPRVSLEHLVNHTHKLVFVRRGAGRLAGTKSIRLSFTRSRIYL